MVAESKTVARGAAYVLFALAACLSASAETLYVDGASGRDVNPGTSVAPLQTLAKAAELVCSKGIDGPTTIVLTPGLHRLTQCVTFAGARQYAGDRRLTIRASVLPDDAEWKPSLMPTVVPAEQPRRQMASSGRTETYSVKVKLSHVTIQGLKFLGNPSANNWHACVERVGNDLTDLHVTQCLFVGDPDTADIYCAAIATGDRFVVDHCIFRNCHACTVFWDGPKQIGGKLCAMRYCIAYGARISAVWTCQTNEDFGFDHNIVTKCKYVWMRKPGDLQRYRMTQCALLDNEYFSGYGVASGPTGQTGKEVTFDEAAVLYTGTAILEMDKTSRNYMHAVQGSAGGDLNAGLFIRPRDSEPR